MSSVQYLVFHVSTLDIRGLVFNVNYQRQSSMSGVHDRRLTCHDAESEGCEQIRFCRGCLPLVYSILDYTMLCWYCCVRSRVDRPWSCNRTHSCKHFPANVCSCPCLVLSYLLVMSSSRTITADPAHHSHLSLRFESTASCPSGDCLATCPDPAFVHPRVY